MVVDAPQQRQDAHLKPKHGADRGRSNRRTAIRSPPPDINTAPAANAVPDHPDIFVFDKDFQNPRTFSASLGYEKEVLNHLAASVAYTYAATDNLTRFVNRNDETALLRNAADARGFIFAKRGRPRKT